MSLRITRDPSGPMRHTLHFNGLAITVDGSVAEGGEASGPSPHDLYDAALGACKALTVLWYANKRQIPVEDIAVEVERDDSPERARLLLIGNRFAQVRAGHRTQPATSAPLQRGMRPSRCQW